MRPRGELACGCLKLSGHLKPCFELAVIVGVMVGRKTSVLVSVAVIIWGIAVMLCALLGSVYVLAMTSDPPNLSEIILALATVGLTLATIALAVAGFLALQGLGESRRDRSAAAMTDMSQRWDNKHFRHVRRMIQEYAGVGADSGIRLRDKIVELRGGNALEYRELLTEPSFLEDLSISINYSGIDFKIVKDSLGYIVWDRWCLWQPTVQELRIRRNEPTVFENFQQLAESIKREIPRLPELDQWDGPKY